MISYGRYMIDDNDEVDIYSTWYNDDDIVLRSKAVRLLVTWSATSEWAWPDNQDRLAQLLGYKYYDAMLNEWNDNTRRKLEMLVGPHGYTVYKAMLARK